MRNDKQRGSFAADEQGISEVLGYIIVFSIVITAVLVVVLGGMSALEDGRDAERAMNAERAFDVLSENVAAIYEGDAPSRATELDLGGGELFYGDNITMSVYDSGSNSSSNLVVEREITPVELSVIDERGVIYEAGAVFRSSEGGRLTMVKKPPFRFSSPVHIPVIQTTAPAFESAGDTVLLLRSVAENRTVDQTGSFSGDMIIEIESPRYEAWAAGLDEYADVSCTPYSGKRMAHCRVNLFGVVTVITHQIGLDIVL